MENFSYGDRTKIMGKVEIVVLAEGWREYLEATKDECFKCGKALNPFKDPIEVDLYIGGSFCQKCHKNLKGKESQDSLNHSRIH